MTASGAAVDSLITYSLPDGANDVDCSAPSSSIKLSVDPGDAKDCNELQNVSEVKKHVCISLFVNDLRSLKATTEYLVSSSYGRDTTLNV